MPETQKPADDIVSTTPGRRRRGKNVDRRIVAVDKQDRFFRKAGAVARSGTRKHPPTFDIW